MSAEAQKILEMIENVDPADVTALDEIDLLVEEWRIDEVFERDATGRRVSKDGWYVSEPLQVTRSRDALKAIRPEDWYFDIEAAFWSDGARYYAQADSPLNETEIPFVSGDFLTEELAELHAIIQAIDYERTSKDGV